jgi:hypothetical protein
MGKARDISKILTTVENIDVTEQLDERIFISSASPTSGNIDGRIWIDTTTASAPVLQTYGLNSFKKPRLLKTKASGGIITEVGQYIVHTFFGSESFVAFEALSVEYLVVAGGGGGNHDSAGGGGAGGLLTGTLLINSGTYPVTVGSGGAYATNGSNSIFSSITSTGGGRGAGNALGGSYAVSNGGSGGGRSGGGSSGPGGLGIVGQGNNGGSSNVSASNYGAGGGGGAGGPGESGTGSSSGNGGIGIQLSINGTSTYYAGGGGGTGFSGQGNGGLGGGGNGGLETSTNGAVNTGGGAGGGNSTYQRFGGSGIVIIRYLT